MKCKNSNVPFHMGHLLLLLLKYKNSFRQPAETSGSHCSWPRNSLVFTRTDKIPTNHIIGSIDSFRSSLSLLTHFIYFAALLKITTSHLVSLFLWGIVYPPLSILPVMLYTNIYTFIHFTLKCIQMNTKTQKARSPFSCNNLVIN